MNSIRRLIIFCSVQPHNVPPQYLNRVADNFALQNPVIYIDMPTEQYRFSFTQMIVCYFGMVKFILKPVGVLIWQPGKSFTFLHFLILRCYLVTFKIIYKLKVILYTTTPKKDKLYSILNIDFSVFDCYDNPNNELKLNSETLKKYDLVCSSFPMLFSELKSIHKNACLVSAGIHNHTFDNNFVKHQIPKSVVFFGGISHRISYDWVYQAIRSNPSVRFYFIGEMYLNKYYTDQSDKNCLKLWKKIVKEPNVYYWNTFIEPDFAPKLLSLFKIGIIPYDVNHSYNYNSHPIKFYDYVASGLTVISSALPSIVQYKARLPVYIASSAKEFSYLVKKYGSSNKQFSLEQIRSIVEVLKSQSLDTKLNEYNNIFKKYKV